MPAALAAFFCLVLATVLTGTAGADGTLDPAFGAHATGRTIVFFDRGGGDADVAKAIVVDPATRELYLAGTVDHSGGPTSGLGVGKLSPNGFLVSSFGNVAAGRMVGLSAGIDLEPLAVTVGGIGAPRLVGASSASASGEERMFTADVDVAGTGYIGVRRLLLLPGGGAVEPYVYAATVDGAGRPLVCGLTVIDGATLGFVARLTPAGEPDPTFGLAGVGWVAQSIIDPALGATWCEGVEVDPQGRVLSVLHAVNFSTLQQLGAVERRLVSGASDLSFAGSGLRTLNARPDSQPELLTDVAVSDYGDIYLVGYAQGPVVNSRAAILFHLSEDGGTLNSFGLYFIPTAPHSYSRLELTRAVVDPAGRLVAGGTLIEGSAPLRHRMVALRLPASLPLGLDSSFGAGGLAFVSFTAVAGFSRERADLEDLIVAPDGRLLLVGRALFGPSGDNYDFAVARLQSAALFLDGFETGSPGRWSSSSP